MSFAIEKSPQVKHPNLKLREKIRDYHKAHRNKLRGNAFDSLRFRIGEIKEHIQELEELTEKDVTGLAGRIRRRRHATSDDMYRLSHAFLQAESNIEVFNKIPGAIQVLVKEFTGKDSDRQLSSAECFCNLSLGQAHVCEKLSSLAGSYLITYLHTTESELVRMCLWTIANILSTGLKGALTLMQMQLLPQLWKLYTDDKVADECFDFREDAAICLQIVALKSDILLKHDEREYILEHFAEKNPTCSGGEYHLQIIFHVLFSRQDMITNFTNAQQQYLVSYSLSNICSTKEFKTNSQQLRILYSIRILSNIIACQPKCYSMLLYQISTNWQTNIIVLLNILFEFKNSNLNREVLWLTRNILIAENTMGTSKSIILEKIKIPKTKSVEDDVERMII